MRFSALDNPWIFNITKSAHRIHNPLTPEKLATLGAALRLEPGTRVLDFGSGSGERLCTWACDCGVIGTGIDMSRLFTGASGLTDLVAPPGNRLESLKGDLKGLYSIRVNDPWRIVFRWQGSDAHEVRLTDYHR
jgi:hypothetical protein